MSKYLRVIQLSYYPLVKFIILPAAVYLTIFTIITYPLITYFNSHILSDSLDSLQNIWNFWWYKQAASSETISLWETTHLFHPFGNSLYTHALTPLNGFLTLLFDPILSLEQTYNLFMVGSFVLSGVSMFWLTYTWINSYLPALLAGFWFTFSAYHFAHASSHIEIASMQWLTLYLLSLLLLLKKPTILKAIMAAVMLRVVLWNTPYHFLYGSIVTGILVTIDCFSRWRQRSLQEMKVPLVLFTLAIFSMCFGQIKQMMILNITDSIVQAHLPEDYSLELLEYVIPGEGWRFNQLTESFWKELSGGPEEAAAYLGIVVILLAIFGLASKRPTQIISKWHLLLLFLIFTALALGPLPQWWGHRYYIPISRSPGHITLPYDWLTRHLPFLKISDLPLRMVIIPTLTASMLAGLGMKRLLVKKHYFIATLLVAVSVLETLPAPWKLISVPDPSYLPMLTKLPDGNVYDTTTKDAYAMYYQTKHGKPIANGYLARVSMRTEELQNNLSTAWENKDYWLLCNTFSVRYLLTEDSLDEQLPIYHEQNINLYDLSNSQTCFGSKLDVNK